MATGSCSNLFRQLNPTPTNTPFSTAEKSQSCDFDWVRFVFILLFT
eukprot:CAMPEP_0198332424 /NCGR_PEP_ID=MMETSP1450-20131203/18276_1 /TAXON_ID=753684 ORGANISM="Madagascaria erythrocladiodes, Strain CCMP3234" /NCGR_SAMPLE_ID=MMETSP1450 /ASSEMBLY_ACC=CAM_ASM_001115 /LENGTH=45 /DNA_ID= /DNA_START= /DNA_END= /DNA_ORIENTATION=